MEKESTPEMEQEKQKNINTPSFDDVKDYCQKIGSLINPHSFL